MSASQGTWRSAGTVSSGCTVSTTSKRDVHAAEFPQASSARNRQTSERVPGQSWLKATSAGGSIVTSGSQLSVA